jgi:hypothetical protein
MFSLKSDLRFCQFEVEWSNKLWFARGERCEIPICIAPNPVLLRGALGVLFQCRHLAYQLLVGERIQ